MSLTFSLKKHFLLLLPNMPLIDLINDCLFYQFFRLSFTTLKTSFHPRSLFFCIRLVKFCQKNSGWVRGKNSLNLSKLLTKLLKTPLHHWKTPSVHIIFMKAEEKKKDPWGKYEIWMWKSMDFNLNWFPTGFLLWKKKSGMNSFFEN